MYLAQLKWVQMKLGFKITALLILLVCTVEAQYSNKIHFRNISVKDGLSFPAITCILQDQKGFIWIGTQVGLNKYDSQKFKVYYAGPNHPGSLSNDYITCLYEDGQQRLWAGTVRGLNIYDSETATFIKFDDELLGKAKIQAVAGDKKGNIWVLTPQYLILLRADLKVVRKYHVDDIAPDKETHAFSTASVDPEGSLWIVANKGLRMFDPATQKLTNPLQDDVESFSTNLDFISVIFFDKKGRKWVAGRGNGLRYYDPQNGQWKWVNNLSSKYINGLIEDVNHKIWVCTGRNGLNIYDPETDEVEVIRYAEKPESNFVSNSLSCVAADNQGGIWIGTFNNGLQYYFQHQLKFNLYYSEGQISGINTNYITSFAVNKDNNIWIGAGEEGLLFFDREDRSFKNIKPGLNDIKPFTDLKENFYVLSLLLSEDEEHLFIGTLTGIYDYRISEKKWRYVHQQLNEVHTQSGGFVLSMAQDGSNIYMATYQGMSVYNFQTGECKKIEPPVPFFRGSSLVQKDSFIFVGTRYQGLWRFDKKSGTLKKVKVENQGINLPDDIRTMVLDRNNRLLIGTESEGLFRCNLDFTKIEKLDSRFQNRKLAFMSICEDSRSGYWIATNQGLARVNETLRIQKMFDQGEGFEPEYFLPGALVKTPSNEIIAGGNTGLYSFFPDDFFTPNINTTVKIHLTDFLLLNKSVLESDVEGFQIRGDLDANQVIRLPKYRNLLTLEYAALDFHNPSRINYAYRLEPYEKEWNNVGNRRFATYRDLPAGTYTFKVKTLNADGIASTETASLRVIIPPKPWLTWWAYLLYASVVFLVSRQFYLYRKNRRKLRQEIEMQKFQKEKAEELYNFKIDFFTQVTHELRTPLTLIIGPLEELINRNSFSSDSNLLKLIHRNTQKLLRNVNQILDFRKIENSEMKVFAKKGNIVAFAEEIFYSFLGSAQQKGIELHFETNMETYPYVLFDRDIMEKILVNLIANAVKFTQSGRISLHIYEAQNQSATSNYYIKLSDTGRGIKPENLDKIFESFFQEKRETHAVGSGLGLKMVKELTGLHRGAIEVTSKLDEGTTFLLTFPKADLELMDTEPAKPGVSQQMEQQIQPKSTEKEAAPESAKILIVDDEADILAFLANVFEGYYQVCTTDTAQKAIELAKSEMPDIIISDVMMPEMNGYELCEYTKSDFLLRHIPVVLLTALKTTEHEIEGLRTGADAYISKPFSVELLKATVQNLLVSRQKLKQAFLNSSVNDAGILTQDNSDQEFIKNAIAAIEEKIEEAGLETAYLANKLGMSSSTFYRKLKSLTGLSGNEFIRTVRLKRSVEYLKNTSFNVSEVAYQVGFSDPKYFATCFKKMYHLTPSDFAEQNRK